MIRRLFCLPITILIILVMFSACGGPQPANNLDSTSTAVPEVSRTPKKPPSGNRTPSATKRYDLITSTSSTTTTTKLPSQPVTTINLPITPQEQEPTFTEANLVTSLYEDWETSETTQYIAYWDNVIRQSGSNSDQLSRWGVWETGDTASESITNGGGTKEQSPMRAEVLAEHGSKCIRLSSYHDEALNDQYGYTENVLVVWQPFHWDVWGVTFTEASTISFDAYGERNLLFDYNHTMYFQVLAYDGENALKKLNYHFLHSQEDEISTPERLSEYPVILEDKEDHHYKVNPLADLKADGLDGREFQNTDSIRVVAIAFELPDVGYLDVDNIRLDNVSFQGGYHPASDFVVKVSGTSDSKISGTVEATIEDPHAFEHPYNADETITPVDFNSPAELKFRAYEIVVNLQTDDMISVEIYKDGQLIASKETTYVYIDTSQPD